MSATNEHQSRRGDQLEREAQRTLRERQVATSVAGPEGRARVLTDGGEDDEFEAAELREGETRDDDNVHDLRNEQQMAIAEGELGDSVEIRDPLDVGDHVTESDSDSGPRMVVVVDTGERADELEREIDGDVQTIAQANPNCDPDERVYEVAFANRTDVDLRNAELYAYPRSHLEVENRIHDRGDAGEGGDE